MTVISLWKRDRQLVQLNNYFTLVFSLFISLPTFLVAQSPSWSCAGHLNVTLDQQCSRTITPGMLLYGDDFTNLDVKISINNATTNQINGCGTHTYALEITENDEVIFSCWGTILAEDQTAPSLICPPNTAEATLIEDMQVFQGELSATDEVFQPAETSCFPETSPPWVTGDYYYDSHSFQVSSVDIFTFIGTANFDGMLALYNGDFNPAEPCQNLLAIADQTYQGSADDFDPIMPVISPSFRIHLGLSPNFNYTLVFTSRTPLVEGEHAIAILSDNNGRVLNLSKSQILVAKELVCLDVDEIYLNTPQEYATDAAGELILDYSDPFRISEALRSGLRYTGFPTIQDNCSAMIVRVHDQLVESGDCGEWTITRTFEVRDRYQSNCTDPVLTSVCSQIITIRKPTIADIVFPPFTTTLECDEVFATDGAMGGPEDNPAPAATGFPYLATATKFYDLNSAVCALGASYSDEPRAIECPGTYGFRRQWNFVDWCNPTDNLQFDQYIRVGDFTGPTITLAYPNVTGSDVPEDRFRFSTAPNDCVAYVPIPTPQVNDGNACSGVAEVVVEVQDADGDFLALAAPGEVVVFTLGDYELNYCAQDSCGNENCSRFALRVEDWIAPTASCNDALTISIGGEGYASISATDLDEGSNDNCSEVTTAIRRSATDPWSETVSFSCQDLGDSIEVHLQVVDQAGNESTCWLSILAEDKIRPICSAPEDLTIRCTELATIFPGDVGTAYLSDFATTSILMMQLFGTPTGTDNCNVDTLVEYNPMIQLNDCGWGSITRRFAAWQVHPAGDANQNDTIDADEVWTSDNTCQQVITISEYHEFKIDFPEDISSDCTAEAAAEIAVEATGCDVLVINQSEPIVFATGSEVCQQISMDYDVINWCLWDGESEGAVIRRRTEADGFPLAEQIGVEGNERPVLHFNSATGARLDRNHTDRAGDSNLPDQDENDAEGEAYVGDLHLGRYRYTQHIRVVDTTAPTIIPNETAHTNSVCGPLPDWHYAIDPLECSALVQLSFTVADPCLLSIARPAEDVDLVRAELDLAAFDANGDGTINGNEFVTDEDITAQFTELNGQYELSIELPFIPASTTQLLHTIRVVVEDACGNRSSSYFPIQLIDCQAPAPICIHDLSTQLSLNSEAGCSVAIWASDFVASPVYDCNGQGPETDADGLFAITEYAIYRTEDILAAGDEFIPNPEDTGLVLTEEDDAFVPIRIYTFDALGNYNFCETQLNLLRGSCPYGAGSLSGTILTNDGQAVSNVTVNLSGNEVQTATTAMDGTYQFEQVTTGTDLSLTPYLNDDHLNGVTTLDIILMAKHILGVQPFDNPYQFIAADVNRSGSVSTLDLITVRKLILNMYTHFPNNTSWRFVATDYAFPSTNNPWVEVFPELVNFNNFSGEATQDWIGIKIGDVNGTVSF
ncbi:MAG: hypothetical protein AAGJ82_03400 [Bacteroidota bacterium]